MAALKKTLAVATLLIAVAACSSSAETQGTPGALDSTGTTVPIPIGCPDGEHLETDGTGVPRCVVHPPDWTGDVEPVDPDQAAIELARELVTDPQRFADIIVGISPSVVDVSDIEFTRTNADLGTAGISFGVTTQATTDAERDSVAWAVMLAVADFWGPGGGFRNETGQVVAGATLTVDSVLYVAPMELMMQVYDFTISDHDFITASRRG